MPDLPEEPHNTAPSRRPVMVFYATRDGQSRRIAARISDRLAARGIAISLNDSAGERASADDLATAAVIVLVAAVRYGRHLPEALQLLAGCRTPGAAPLALASVNLTARKPGKDTADGNPYLQKLIARTGCRPAIAAAFAGRLDYPRYRWLDRQIIRAIMWMTGGPTDPRASVEYTAWDTVDAFAAQIAQLHARETVARAQQASFDPDQ
jgi:menaquinone-dependent protoporphyrinogen oxidase